MKRARGIGPGELASREIVITRIVRVQTWDENRTWFDLAITTELEAFVRVAGLPDSAPWESRATDPTAFGATMIVSGVTMAREGVPVEPSPRVEFERLEREARIRAFDERRARLGDEGMKDTDERRLDKIEARTGTRPVPYVPRWQQRRMLVEDEDDEGGGVAVAGPAAALHGGGDGDGGK